MAELRFLKILKEGDGRLERVAQRPTRGSSRSQRRRPDDIPFNGIINSTTPTLSGADLRGRPLFRAQFHRAVLKEAALNRADLR